MKQVALYTEFHMVCGGGGGGGGGGGDGGHYRTIFFKGKMPLV